MNTLNRSTSVHAQEEMGQMEWNALAWVQYRLVESTARRPAPTLPFIGFVNRMSSHMWTSCCCRMAVSPQEDHL